MAEQTQSIFDKYSDRFLEMASTYAHAGIPDTYDATGQSTGQCGDTIQFFIGVRHRHIISIRFAIEGCMHTLACANSIIDMVAEKTIDEAWEVTDQAVIENLGGIPKDHEHCAQLTIGALYKALANLNGKPGKA